MSARFEALGIPFERFPAIDAQKISDEDFAEFSKARPRIEILGKWTKGKMACFLSHQGARQLAAESPDAYTAIFEDDMVLSPFVGTVIKDSSWIPEDCDIVRLEAPMFRVLLSSRDSVSVGGRKLQKVMPNRFRHAWAAGAGGYIIRKEAARRFVDAPPEFHVYNDNYLFNCTASEVARQNSVHQIVPACCIQSRFHFDPGSDNYFNSEIEVGDNSDLYEPRHGRAMRLLKNYGRRLNLLKAFRKVKAFVHIACGYKMVPYSD